MSRKDDSKLFVNKIDILRTYFRPGFPYLFVARLWCILLLFEHVRTFCCNQFATRKKVERNPAAKLLKPHDMIGYQQEKVEAYLGV